MSKLNSTCVFLISVGYMEQDHEVGSLTTPKKEGNFINFYFLIKIKKKKIILGKDFFTLLVSSR